MIDTLLARQVVPDALVRIGIRRLLARRLREIDADAPAAELAARETQFAESLARLPVAINTEASKSQHYEVPAAFYQAVLGPHLKYSCGWFERGTEELGEAEVAMLERYVKRARLADGQRILELGCGWGSFCLWLAARQPRSRITAVSHSRSQKAFIEAEAQRRGLRNLTVLTSDMNDFRAEGHAYDRVVSVEMFEHMKNWPRLLQRVAGWLKPGGLFFLHIFTHRGVSYHFEARDASDWMSRYFFTGGMMPSHSLLRHFQDDLQLVQEWIVNGRHYQCTAECWLKNMDAAELELRPLFVATYGPNDAARWWSYWRVFFMACAELWGYRGGQEWHVSHYLMQAK